MKTTDERPQRLGSEGLRRKLALSWCDYNAKKLSEQDFIRRVEKLIGEKYYLRVWKKYAAPKPTLKERILREMVVTE
jgi:hypothetical protein